MQNLPQLLLAVPGAVLLVGCVHNERYPQFWEPVQVGAATDCANLAATYSNDGENSNGARTELAPWLEPRQNKSVGTAAQQAYLRDLIKAQTVQLQVTATVLTVVASGKDIHREWSFDSSNREFECKHGVVHIHRFEVASDIVLLVSRRSEYLYRVGDHLIVDSRDREVGLALIVPVAGVTTSWARFAVIPNSGSGLEPGREGKP